MNTTFNPARKMLIIVILITLFVLITGMACAGDSQPGLLETVVNNCKNNACGITSPAGDAQQTITNFVQDSCPKDANGYCKVIGQ